MLHVVCWRAGTGRLCEWTTADQDEAQELCRALGMAGCSHSVEELSEPGDLVEQEELWANEFSIKNAG
jgi:hypothetical protein